MARAREAELAKQAAEARVQELERQMAAADAARQAEAAKEAAEARVRELERQVERQVAAQEQAAPPRPPQIPPHPNPPKPAVAAVERSTDVAAPPPGGGGGAPQGGGSAGAVLGGAEGTGPRAAGGQDWSGGTHAAAEEVGARDAARERAAEASGAAETRPAAAAPLSGGSAADAEGQVAAAGDGEAEGSGVAAGAATTGTWAGAARGVDAWSVDDVLAFFTDQLRLPQYADAVRANDVNGAMLLEVQGDAEALAELGITSKLHVSKIRSSLKTLLAAK